MSKYDKPGKKAGKKAKRKGKRRDTLDTLAEAPPPTARTARSRVAPPAVFAAAGALLLGAATAVLRLRR